MPPQLAESGYLKALFYRLVRAVLDTCVIYPTVMREMLLGVAATGAFEPLWSDRILEEWALAARKAGTRSGEAQARGEVALVSRALAKGRRVTWKPSLEDRLWLPDQVGCACADHRGGGIGGCDS